MVHASSDQNSRNWSLVLFLALGLIPLYWYLAKGKLPSFIQFQERTTDVVPGVTDWYLTLKLPEAPFEERAAQDYKSRFSSWLSILNREGFHPMLLSDVQDRINRGKGLPDKTIVLLFEPGLVQTYQWVSPILRLHNMPAVWITNAAAVKRSNRRYVSNFTLWKMRHSGLWDVGSYQGPNILQLDTRYFGQQTFGNLHKAAWTTDQTSRALNYGHAWNSMNRLKVNPSWSDRELISRILNEVPVRETSQLTVRQVEDRNWGVAIPGIAFSSALFSLKAPLDKRATSVSWPGTIGQADFDLQMDLASVVGELWLLVRSNRETGEAIRIGYLPDNVVVELGRQKKRERLAQYPFPYSRRKGFSSHLSLHGTHLQISLQGNPAIDLSALPAPAFQGMVELMVYNPVRGTASAEGVRLIYMLDKK